MANADTARHMDARNICLDKRDCKLQKTAHFSSVQIRKGAHILSNTRHLGRGAKFDAIRYTTTRAIVLCIVDTVTDLRVKNALLRLAFRTGKHGPTDVSLANNICTSLGVDGWYVTPRHPRGERLVLIDARSVLK